jgi:hypothetical protein
MISIVFECFDDALKKQIYTGGFVSRSRNAPLPQMAQAQKLAAVATAEETIDGYKVVNNHILAKLRDGKYESNPDENRSALFGSSPLITCLPLSAPK